MDQSLGALFSGKIVWTDGPEAPQEFPLRPALVHGWRFPDKKSPWSALSLARNRETCTKRFGIETSSLAPTTKPQCKPSLFGLPQMGV